MFARLWLSETWAYVSCWLGASVSCSRLLGDDPALGAKVEKFARCKIAPIALFEQLTDREGSATSECMESPVTYLVWHLEHTCILAIGGVF